ncbi:hypothetical protein DFH28DRAFT_1228940 [Melampsora americana]|nr:hypothetical protein DFH28DRAFT_1228940 [Melampsora americana]
MIKISIFSSIQILLFLFSHPLVKCRSISKRGLKQFGPDLGFVGTVKANPDSTPCLGGALDLHLVKLQDLRTCEKPDLMTHGFTWVSGRKIVGHEDYQTHVEEDSVAIVKKMLNTESAICLESTLRGPGNTETEKPLPVIHTDLSKEGAQLSKMYYQNQFLESGNPRKIQFGKKLQENKGFVIINVWRPIHTVTDHPLGLCKWNSLSKEDIFDTGGKSTSTSTSTLVWKYHKDQEWAYLSSQKPDEVFVFMQHDSTAKDGQGIHVPHAAFIMANDDPHVQQRTSIQCSVMAFVDAPLPDSPLPERRFQ